MKKIKMFKSIIKVVLIIVLIILVVIVLPTRLNKKKQTMITSSTLTKMVDISELSSAKFTYNGIAEAYTDENENKIKCRIRYDAVVEANINMNEIQFDIDKKKKTVKPILPEIKLTPNVITSADSPSFIPEDTSIELKEVLIVCEKDAQEEAEKSTELMDVAKGNLRNTVEALLFPIVESNGYKIIWE